MFETECLSEFPEEPKHDYDAECKYEEARPGLPFVYVRDRINFHLQRKQTDSTSSIALDTTFKEVLSHISISEIA